MTAFRTSIAAAFVVAAATSALSQAPPRDVRRAPPVGTATITGTVVSDDVQPRPLRRVRVTLNSPELQPGLTAITNDDGTFVFDRLPEGRYTIGGAKDGYVSVNHGAVRPGRAGTPIAIKDGEARQLSLRMPRGGVIAGTITDADGQPATGVTVTAGTYRYQAGAGERRLSPAGVNSGTTDDRGTYRIFGLPAGDYVVMALVRPAVPAAGDLQVISEAEIRRALADVRERQSRSQPRPSMAPSSSTVPQPEMRRGVAYSTVFFPGTPSPSRATVVTVGKAEERAGIDFQLQYVPTARVEGTVVLPQPGTQGALVALTPADQTTGTQSVEFRRTAPAGPDGRFTLPGVPPGRYTLMARATLSRTPGTPAGGPPPAPLWASTEIAVDGQDVTDIALTLQRGLTIAGRLAFEGTRPPPPDLTKLRVNLPFALTSTGASIALPPVQLDAAGRFTVDGILPAAYRIGSTIQGIRSPLGAWWLKSIVIDGRDVLDAPLDLRQSADAAIVTFSDRAGELTGAVRDAQGNPAHEYFAIVFGVDPSSWFSNSRRVAGVRPDGNGRYAIRNLPPGDYFIVAVNDVEPGEWFDAALLQRLAAGAARITLGEYEHATHDVTVR